MKNKLINKSFKETISLIDFKKWRVMDSVVNLSCVCYLKANQSGSTLFDGKPE